MTASHQASRAAAPGGREQGPTHSEGGSPCSESRVRP